MLNKTSSSHRTRLFAVVTLLSTLTALCLFSEKRNEPTTVTPQTHSELNTSQNKARKADFTPHETSEKPLATKKTPTSIITDVSRFNKNEVDITSNSLSGLKKDLYLNEEHESPEERAEWSKERDEHEFNMLKDPKTGKIPRDAAKKALEAALKAEEFKIASQSANGAEIAISATIVPRGPNNFGGRTRAIGIDKRNSQIMLAGGASSGVFRTTNGGTSWTRVSPIGAIHNATAIIQDPRSGSEDTWYYGTGESSGNSATLGSSYLGFGIWKSTDNGVNWTALTATQSALETFNSSFDFIHRLVVDPTNGYVYAAACNTIMRSTDGGVNWSTVLGTFANSRYTDIIVTPTGRLYAAFDGREADNGVWTSTTGASGTWTRIAGTGAATNHANWNAQNAYRRVVLAYAPSNTNIVFALYYNNVNSTCAAPAVEAEFFKWDQSTTTWTDLSANLPDEAGCSQGNDPFAVQGGYDLVVAVKPNDVNTVFIGGTNAYRSTNGFTSTAATTRIGGYNSPANYALYANHHSDIHYFTFANGDNNTLYCGDDGGIQKADITATTVAWTSLNNDYVTYQYYYVDINPNSTSITAISGGAQDNGTTICESGTTHFNEWSGDGCQTQLISYTNSSTYHVLVSSQSGSIYRNTATTATNIKPSSAGNGIFVTYFHLDQDNTNYLYYASSNTMYRTRIASTIAATAVTGNSATGWETMAGVGATLSTNISAMATSRDYTYANADYTASNTNRVLYIGTEGGAIYRLNNPAFVTAATAPTVITPSGSAGFVSSIAVNPFDDNEIMVTYANYGVSSVYWTNNAKSATPTWVNVEGPSSGAVALGSARSCIITRIGSTLTYLVGNSTGLFSTQALNAGSTVWDRVGSTSINYALCSSMRLRVTDNKIALGTHGNGMFELQLPSAVLPVELLSFEGKPQVKSNQLTWEVVHEVQFKGYKIERSANGKDNFKEVGFVSAHNLASSQTYTFDDVDKNILKTSTPQYYRLQMEDWANTNPTYSKIVAIQRTLQKSKDWAYTLSPNPTSADLTVDFTLMPETSSLVIQIVDIIGRVFLTENKRSEYLNSSSLNISTQSLPAGTYFLKIQSADGVVKNEKFIKF